MDGIGFRNHVTKGTPGDDTCHVVTVDVAQVNVFFDGTANNYYNVTSQDKARYVLAGEESYVNALSNIARMWSSLGADPTVMALYVEGIGTKRNEEDRLRGLAFGSGEAGILDRVDEAFSKLVELVVRKRGSRGLPGVLDINVFGFSRGAAAARRFVHLVNTEKNERFGGKWKKMLIRCNFVGLFDTVSSFGASHSDDVQELHLNFKANYATKVFHLIAGDEYRLNFPVTTIASALKLRVQTHCSSDAMGYELRIPGAHSDVGGGYNDIEHETRDLDASIKDFVYDQGWYDASLQMRASSPTHERQVHAEYYKVGLAIMVDQAHLHSTVQFPSTLLAPPTNADIRALHSSLREFAKDEKNTDWNLNEKLGRDKARALRRQFMHLSLSPTKGAMVPRVIAKNTLRREVFVG